MIGVNYGDEWGCWIAENVGDPMGVVIEEYKSRMGQLCELR